MFQALLKLNHWCLEANDLNQMSTASLLVCHKRAKFIIICTLDRSNSFEKFKCSGAINKYPNFETLGSSYRKHNATINVCRIYMSVHYIYTYTDPNNVFRYTFEQSPESWPCCSRVWKQCWHFDWLKQLGSNFLQLPAIRLPVEWLVTSAETKRRS